MPVPPGITYLYQHSARLLLPPTLVLLCYKLCRAYLDLPELSAWLLSLALLISLPLSLTSTVVYADYVNERDAARHGARLPPPVQGKLPFGLSLLADGMKNFKTGYPGAMMVQWSKTYGQTFNMRMLFENRMFTTEPEHIKTFLATHFDRFERGPETRYQYNSLLGTGVFNSDGDMWRFHRTITRPFFSKERFSDFELFEKHAGDAIARIKQRLREGYPIDAQDVASRFTLDTATSFLFGKSVDSFSAGLLYPFYSPLSESYAADHPANVFAAAFNEAQSNAAVRSRSGRNWPLREFWRDRVEGPRARVDAFVDPILREAVEKKGKKGVGSFEGEREVKEGESLLDHLLHYTNDKTILRDETFNIFLAGRDTTASLITFAMYMLAEHPEVLRRLRTEILGKLGPNGVPTYGDMREMKYLRAVINETLRLYPSVPFNMRTTNQATVLPNPTGGEPFYIPATTRVIYSVFLMHRRTDLWGPDAAKFDPDRFIDERLHKYLIPNPFIFLPFNAGPRICLGQQFAYHETSYFLIRLLQSFSAINMAPDAQSPETRPLEQWGNVGPKGAEKIWPKTHVTLYALGGCWVRMEEAIGDGL